MNTATHRNGCHNRAPYAARQIVQAGWWMDGVTRVAKMESIPNRMAKDCQYTLSRLGQADQGCTGCTWRKDPRMGLMFQHQETAA
jgi:hypothetical protein